jgi:pyridoxal 5'-phosphate synthase pdxS subunit
MASYTAAAPAEGGTPAEREARGTWTLKKGLAEMLKGGVIMDVTSAEQARIAEAAGAVAVMALERIPADVRAEGGVARMADVAVVEQICSAVSIPVMGKVRIGHFVEAQILEAVGVDYIDESEVLTPADERYHIRKSEFRVPFVCGARDLGEALRRIAEGAAMIRTKGEPGTGNIVEAVSHVRRIAEQARMVQGSSDEELVVIGRDLGAPLHLLEDVRRLGRLPVVNFAAGGIASPADAALLMQLGCDGVFVGSGIFKSGDPERLARAIVRATTHYRDAQVLVEVSRGVGAPMRGLDMATVGQDARMQERGQ